MPHTFYVKKFYLLFSFFLFATGIAYAQTDSLSPNLKNLLGNAPDASDSLPAVKPKADTAFFAMPAPPEAKPRIKKIPLEVEQGIRRNGVHTDTLFYALLAIFLLLALTKSLFPKYFYQVFRFSYQSILNPKSSREQVLQNNLPSALMNLVFLMSGGLLVAMLARYYNWVTLGYGELFLYATLLLAAIYLVKFSFVHFAGWVFNASQFAGMYNNIVFTVNKILGIFLLPLLLVIAYGDDGLKKIAITISACLIIFLFLYRYFFSLATMRSNVNITAFHFFVYLCSVEIMPLLIIYKVFFLEIKSN